MLRQWFSRKESILGKNLTPPFEGRGTIALRWMRLLSIFDDNLRIVLGTHLRLRSSGTGSQILDLGLIRRSSP